MSKGCHLSLRNQGGEVPPLPGNTRCPFSLERMRKFLPSLQKKKKEGTKEAHGTDPRRRLETHLGHQTTSPAQIKSKAVSSTEISVKRAFWKAKVIPLLIFPPLQRPAVFERKNPKTQQTNHKQRPLLHK